MKGFKVGKVIWRHHHIIISKYEKLSGVLIISSFQSRKSYLASSSYHHFKVLEWFFGVLIFILYQPWWPLVKIILSFFALHLVFSIAIEYVQYIRVKYAKKLKYRKVLITVEKLWLLPFPKINQNIVRQKTSQIQKCMWISIVLDSAPIDSALSRAL